eukprot:11637288-Ditylum_brightwellii.AAC.1
MTLPMDLRCGRAMVDDAYNSVLQTTAAVVNCGASVPWWQWRQENDILLVPTEAPFGLLLDIWEGRG